MRAQPRADAAGPTALEAAPTIKSKTICSSGGDVGPSESLPARGWVPHHGLLATRSAETLDG